MDYIWTFSSLDPTCSKRITICSAKMAFHIHIITLSFHIHIISEAAKKTGQTPQQARTHPSGGLTAPLADDMLFICAQPKYPSPGCIVTRTAELVTVW